MMDVPKIVLERLRGSAKFGEHPDADRLTAFAEQALGKHERLRVLEHLARCPECRDVVCVAQPEASETQGSFRLMKPSLLLSPKWRWGAVALCAVVVASLTTRHFLRQKSAAFFRPEARVSTTFEAPQSSQRKTDKFVGRLEAPPPKSEPGLSRRFAKRRTEKTAADSDFLAGAPGEASKKDGNFLSNAAPPAAPSPPLLSKLNDREERDERARNLQNTGGKPASDTATNESVMVEKGAPSVEVAETGKAKEARASSMKASAETSAVGGTVNGNPARIAAESNYAVDLRASIIPLPRWTLSREGKLQRSFNGGQSWQTIPLSSKAVLRALSATGSEIWVGGDAGVLFHSSDSGQHWAQITPAVNSESLTGDIIGIESTDTHSAKLTTSDHEIWATTDEGRSWTKSR